MAKKKSTKAQKLKKQNQRAARQRKKELEPLNAKKRAEDMQKKLDEKNKPAFDFCELVLSKMLDDKCFSVAGREGGGLNSFDDFIDLMYPYINNLEESSAVKEKAIKILFGRIEKIHFKMMMDYLPDVKEIADIVVNRFDSGERSVELREFVQKHCDAGEYSEWENSFWDIVEDRGFTMEDYEALP